MSDLVIKRAKNHKLRVSVDAGRVTISVSGGPAPSDDEIDQVREFLTANHAGEEGERVLAKLAARAA